MLFAGAALFIAAISMNVDYAFKGYGLVEMKTVHLAILAGETGGGTGGTAVKTCYIPVSSPFGAPKFELFCDSGTTEENIEDCPSQSYDRFLSDSKSKCTTGSSR